VSTILYITGALFLVWLLVGVVMKTQTPVRTIKDRVKPKPVYKEMDRFDLEEK
jgi:hypothetical protein